MLKPGEKAPDFSLPADDGSTVTLSELRGRKVVLFFYGKDFTPGWTIEAVEFREEYAEFAALGAEVLGVSPDPVKRHASFREKFDLPYRLLADSGKEVAQMYGVVKEKNRLGVKSQSIERSTFVIDEEGVLEECMYGVTAKGHAEDVLSCVREHVDGDSE